MSAKGDLLYHYTSPEGLKGILSSRKIWATDIFYLNDSAEINYSLDIIKSLWGETWLSVSKTSPLYMTAEYILSGHFTPIVYVAAFSEVADQLSQWRGYCLPTGGFSIGFDKTKLETYIGLQGFKLESCIYGADDHYRLLGGLLRSFLNVAGKRIGKLEKLRDADVVIAEELADFYANIMNLAPQIKSPSFYEEREWRLIIQSRNIERIQVQYRVAGSLLVPYIEMGPIDQDCFSKIVIGPCPHKDLSFKSVKQFAQSVLGRQIEVVKSEIPYRNW